MSDTARFVVGERVRDIEDDDPDPAVVVNTPPATASEWEAYGDTTVAADNTGYPADAPVAVVVFEPDLFEHRPYYTGVRQLQLSRLAEDGVRYYAFPEDRLESVGTVPNTYDLPTAELESAPYHAREFDVAAQREFIDEIADRGYPEPVPLARVAEEGFELINGHKRVWACRQAGIEEIPCTTIYLDALSAAEAWCSRHLDEYDDAQRSRAVDALRERFGEQADAIVSGAVEGGASA